MGGVEKRRELGLKEFFLTGAGGGRRGRRGRRAARKWWPWAPLEAEVGDRGQSDEEGEGDEVGNWTPGRGSRAVAIATAT